MARNLVGYCKVTFLQGIAGMNQADGLTSVDQVTPDCLVEESISGRAETITKS